MKNIRFHHPKTVGAGVRFAVAVDGKKSKVLHRCHPLMRALSAVLVVLLCFSSSPALFAISAIQAFGGAGASGGGGKGSAANLQNAGAASASLTAARAAALQKQTDATVTAMQRAQLQARAAAASGGARNGLANGWLEPWVSASQNGIAANGTPNTANWSGASITSPNGANTVNIVQKTQNAYLYWKNFNVGPQTTVNFDQSAGGNDVGTWIAFNKVMGSVNPTQIFGNITAQGQVYILNQNGILFHNGSQINTHALVASSLPINENLAGDALDGVSARGIANNSDYQFLFTALPVAAGINGPTPSFNPANTAVGLNSSPGDVVVESGATISSPANSSHTGGLVALIGPNVKNSGTISTPNGQTILAAGLQVGLVPHSSSDPSLRGLDVTVGKVSDASINPVSGSAGVAENSGLLSVAEGDTTLAGAIVHQYGVIDSSTSVSLNGRIDLQANYNAMVSPTYNANGTAGAPIIYQDTGTVDIGAGSVMRILPEWSSAETITGSALALNSVVSILGNSIHLENGAIIQAPGAATTSGALSETGAKLSSGVSLNAGSWLGSVNPAIFNYTTGAITLDPGAEISVAGSTGIQVDSSKNFLSLALRGSELANSPLQRTGKVRGVTLELDTRITGTYDGQYWIGTPLGDATGFAALITGSVGQLTAAGGTVSLQAGDSVSLAQGSTLDVSGGWVQYQGGKFKSTKLISQGRLFDISQATPDRIYSGIYSSGATVQNYTKWGVSQTFDSPFDPTLAHYQAAYTQGAAGGSINIQAPLLTLNGSLLGTTTAGPRQVRNSASLSTLPASSSLTLDVLQDALMNSTTIVTASPNPPAVTFAKSGISSDKNIILSPELTSVDGFGNLTILNHDGTIALPAETTLNLGINGSLSLEAANVSIDGSIVAPGGSVSLTADLAPYKVINAVSLLDGNSPSEPITDVVVNKSTGETYAQYGSSSGGITQVVNSDGTLASLPSDQLTHLNAGIVTVGAGAVINTAGTLVNESPQSLANQPIALNGGSVSLSGYQVNATKGSVLDVSGGAIIPATGSVSYGSAGSIAIKAGQDTSIQDIHGGSLELGSLLKGYSGLGATAGTLSITAPAIAIGGSSSDSEVLHLAPDFFNQGGFGTFNLTGIGREIPGSSEFIPGVEIAAGTVIHPEVESMMFAPSLEGTPLTIFTPPNLFRATPTISFAAAGLTAPELTSGSQVLVRGDFVMGAGATITLDPQIQRSGSGVTASTGSVALSGNTVAVLGSIVVPGGKISVTGSGKFISNDLNLSAPLVTVDLASSAMLSTAGEAIYTTDPLGLRNDFGALLSGGSIAVSGNILGESGATLNASGTSGIYDLFPNQLGVPASSQARVILSGVGTDHSLSTPYRIDSSGGTISLSGGEELYSDATLVAHSGGPTAAGGSLSISSGVFEGVGQQLNLAISQNSSAIPVSLQNSGGSAIGQAVPAAGGISEGGGHVAINTFANGGFDNVTLSGNLIFNGPISLSVPGSLKVATMGMISADSTVNLSASYVALGTPFLAPLAPGSAALSTAFGTPTIPNYVPPNFGTGKLNITAQLIDVGNLSLLNIGSAKLNATKGGGGVIRGDGTLDIAGDIVMTAAEIYPATGVNFTVAAYNHDASSGAAVTSGGIDGSVTVQRSGSAGLPLSAGGVLSLYAASITQGGVLAAPFGVINLGNSGTGTVPLDPVSGLAVPTANNLLLSSGSMTSISGIDQLSGLSITVPYGTSSDGSSWVDPSGTAITTTGLPGKSVNLTAQNIVTQSGSTVDLQGGGNLTAVQWISGLGGTINILGSAASTWAATPAYAAGDLVTYKGNTWSARQANSGVTPAVGLYWSQVPQSYAVIPGYQSSFAPTGYSDGSIGVGSKVNLTGGGGLPSGTYTLLPASYANQPGAYLISKSSASANLAGSIVQPDGTVLVSGTVFNGMDSAVTAPQTATLFQLSSPTQIAKQAQYTLLNAGSFFSSVASSAQPVDAGKLVFQATTSLALNGAVQGGGASGGRGASIDISVPGAIDITQNGQGGIVGDVVLGADQLSSWGFGSLLIGGLRGTPVQGVTPITVTASDITEESGATLHGNDIILAANNSIVINAGATVSSSGSSVAPDESISISGDGVALRTSGDRDASVTRNKFDTASITGLMVNAGANISGSSITLDSSGNASIDATAALNGQIINLNAGKIALNFDGSTESGAMNLSGNLLQNLNSAQKLNLTSYSTIDFHGSGMLGSSSLASIALHAGEILGDNNGSDAIDASSILLDNANAGTDPSGGNPNASGGALTVSGSILTLGSGALSVGGFQNVTANLSGGIEGSGKGTLALAENLSLNTPILTGAGSAATIINAGGNLTLASAGSSLLSPGLGVSMNLKGTTVSIAAPITLPSGAFSAEATTGDLTVSSLLDVGGFSQSYFNYTAYTDAGSIKLNADQGNLILAGSTLNLAAQAGAGSAGSLSLSAPNGTIASLPSSLSASAPHGTGGSFTADLKYENGSSSSSDLGVLESVLSANNFVASQNIRIRSGDVSVVNVKAYSYTLSADSGSIQVTQDQNGADAIDASGVTGGAIALQAEGSITVNAGATLDVHGDTYDSAGKGGSIFLSAGAEVGGIIDPSVTLDLQSGSAIDLGVTAAATSIQDFGGVLHLRTPENALQNISLNSTITGASSIEVEGYNLYSVSGTAGNITTALRSTIASDIANFYGAAGVNSAQATAILAQLTQNLDPANSAVLNLAPGVEIINAGGGLTLAKQISGTGVNNNAGDWNLATVRAGANSAPGFLTLRASGDITLKASISDGFVTTAYNSKMLSQNTALPANFQSWGYQITAGSDLTAANPNEVQTTSLANIALGNVYNGNGQNVAPSPGASALTTAAIAGTGYNYFQVIRTGTGNISLTASGSLQLWNQFSTIYTAGVQVTDPTLAGTFDTPSPKFNSQSQLTTLGAPQQTVAYTPQFSYAGGNIVIDVGQDITQLTQDINHNTIADSVSEMPSNWLYRRGALDPFTGTFLQTTFPVNEVASTAWWVDFSNFFDDLGALGGGNITLNAGGNISNINASIPTNFRMPGKDASGNLIQAGSVAGTELGGGNLSVNAGNNLDAGVYYIEKGEGSLKAGGSIITNKTRDPNHTSTFSSSQDSELSYLPTTLFLGKGSFNIQAAGDILLGSVANVFLSPQGVNNSYWYKDYFSTYASTDQVNVTSLGGNITFRESAVTALISGAQSILSLWFQGFSNPSATSPPNISASQPWLRLSEQAVDSSLTTLLSIAPPSLNASALSGDITVQGNYTTAPSSVGNITLIASGNINGLAEAGLYSSSPTSSDPVWIASQINLSDANPDAIPGIDSPLSQRSTTPSTITSQTPLIIYNGRSLTTPLTSGIAALFAESGSYTGTYGALQTKLQLHDSTLLHAADTTPLQIYAQSGDISGLTLFSGKYSEISAGGDITDVGLYIQNDSANNVSIVSAGGSITGYDPSSTLQILAQAQNSGNFVIPLQSGDLQINGPGTLEVLAGASLDLGNGANNADGTGVGITSIGNSRNPALPFAGADVIVGAGVKLPTGLSSSSGLGLAEFASTVLSGSEGATYLSELSETMTYSGAPLTESITAASFAPGSTQLSSEEKARLELQLFYIVLRDTGRNHNKEGSPGYGNYNTGEEAIKTFFANTSGSGNITTWSREIATVSGGNISMFAPNGGLTLASTSSGSTLTPPGIITEHGGGISIYTQKNVSIGIGRIFTLRGGDIVIWSDKGNIAAGSSSKTVQTAPPTRVIIDPQSGNVETDLAGLATGGGIGVLATVADVPPGNVDLIAPSGVIDAGDAGIRSTGNLNLAATAVLNADNIAASGTTSGAPPAAPPPAAPNISGAAAASAAGAASTSTAENATKNNNAADTTEAAASVISVEVLGYGGGDGEDDNSQTPSANATPAPQASL